MNVLYDIHVFINAVASLGHCPTEIPTDNRFGLLLKLVEVNPTNFHLAWSDHHHWHVVNILSRDYGWTVAEATKWADRCAALQAVSGGTYVPEVDAGVARRWADRARVQFRVLCPEDALVTHIALAAKAELVVTDDRNFRTEAKVPRLAFVSSTDFCRWLEGQRTRQPVAA